MSRKEDFKKASQSLENQVISNPWTLFEKGCEYGYQCAVDKACEWLESMSGYVVCGQKANVNNFRKAMQ